MKNNDEFKNKSKNKKNSIDKNWRKLDNSAKIFPIISNRKFSTIFRLSVVLKEEISGEILLKSLKQTLKKFDTFKVKQKRGLFWYFLESNDKKIMVEREDDYPCKPFDKIANNKYLFKVTYFEKKINLEIFHSITDGNTAIDFLKELMYNYLDIVHEVNGLHDVEVYKGVENEDSYLKNYDRGAYKPQKQKSAYLLKGRSLPMAAVGVTHGFVSVRKLKEVSKIYNATITEYIVAKLMCAIVNKNYIKYGGIKPLRICVPINLKKYYDSKTLLNFFSCAYIENDFNDKNQNSFNDLINSVKNEFKEKINEDAVKTRLAQDVKLGNNFFIRILPLMLKKATIQLTYSEIRKYVTTTVSNLGPIKVSKDYEKYIDNFLVLLSPEKSERLKCSAISFNDTLSFSFTSVFDNDNIEREFFRLLSDDEIEVKIDGNGVYDAISEDL